ncbi:MAG: PIN domain-containing protein [Bacteroidota bacterium]
MSNYFLDTNILVDFLGNREPFGKYALKIFKKGVSGDWTLWTSSNSILTSYYIIGKIEGWEIAKKKTAQLVPLVEINPMSKGDLLHALNSNFKDVEDAAQHSCAIGIKGIDGIITRNKKDFKHSQLKVYNPSELFSD